MLKLGRRARGHFMTLIEIRLHLIRAKPGHICVSLEGQKMLQELCKENSGWDDPVPAELKAKWERWRSNLPLLQEFSVPRRYKPKNLGHVTKRELHHFSDASNKGYGQCSYLRLTDERGQIHCFFVIGKSRVTPLKPVTIPRLELTAAVTSVRISDQLKGSYSLKILKKSSGQTARWYLVI